MKIHRIVEKTLAEGPGCRFCIWVQGCTHHCDGCFATDTWDINAGEHYTVEQITGMLNKVINQLDGITLLGGEPFLQAEELSQIAGYVKSQGKSVIAFSGFTYKELLNSQDSSVKKLLQNTDLLIDGRYIEALQDFSRPLVGSSNQSFVYLTDKISPLELEAYKNRFELRISKDGAITVNGMGDINKLSNILNTTEFRRI